MILIVLTVVVIALLTAVLTTYLFMLGVLLNRIADNLEDGLQSMKMVFQKTHVVGPGVTRLNRIGGELIGALPLLCEAAEQLVAKPPTPVAASPGVGYMDM